MKTEDLVGLFIPIIYLLMFSIESRYAARPYEQVHRWSRTGSLFFVMVLIVGSLTPLLLPLAWFKAQPVMDLSGLGMLGIPIGVLTVTFFGYWLHRAEHRFDWLWRAAHQLHHSALRVDMAGAYFTHPIEVMLKVTMATTISIYLLGLAPMAASIVGLVGAVLSMWQHLNINTPHWLGYIVHRPESHVLHHERALHARNYADLPLWDMLFGTFVNPRTQWTGKVGFDRPYNQRLLDMLLMRDVHK